MVFQNGWRRTSAQASTATLLCLAACHAAAAAGVWRLAMSGSHIYLICSAADLKQPEPLAAAGIEPQQRLFEVTVANILQVRQPRYECTRGGGFWPQLLLLLLRPEQTALKRSALSLVCSVAWHAGPTAGPGTPPGGLHQAGRPPWPLRCMLLAVSYAVCERSSAPRSAGTVSSHASCMRFYAPRLPLRLCCRHFAGADSGSDGGLQSLVPNLSSGGGGALGTGHSCAPDRHVNGAPAEAHLSCTTYS
jgi:hypothetical protein